jgi:hypothetical protein
LKILYLGGNSTKKGILWRFLWSGDPLPLGKIWAQKPLINCGFFLNSIFSVIGIDCIFLLKSIGVLTKVLSNLVLMDIKLEHAFIIEKKNQLVCSSYNGDIQSFFSVK